MGPRARRGRDQLYLESARIKISGLPVLIAIVFIAVGQSYYFISGSSVAAPQTVPFPPFFFWGGPGPAPANKGYGAQYYLERKLV